MAAWFLINNNIAFLKSLLQAYEEGNRSNATSTCALTLNSDFPPDDEVTTLLRKVLWHPNCNVSFIYLEELDETVLGSSSVMDIVLEWYWEMPARSPRKLVLRLHLLTLYAGTMFDGLREYLCESGNCMEVLHLGVGARLAPCREFLGPVLANANNELKELHLTHEGCFTDDEAKALARGLASPNCKVTSFRLRTDLTFNATRDVVEGLCSVRSLKELDLTCVGVIGNITDENILINQLTRLLERPGNKLFSLHFGLTRFGQDHMSSLAKALTSEHCQLEELDYDYRFHDGASLPICVAIRHPNNRLKKLALFCRGEAVALALKESLKDPNCKLETLKIDHGEERADGQVVVAIAEALRTSSCNRLRKLQIGLQPLVTIQAVAESLRSPNNKLTRLDMSCPPMEKASRVELYRIVRRSNLTFWDGPDHPFVETLNKRFFRVLHTLLSVKHVPRIGREATMRLLPMQDLILRIAETLGWPLQSLRLDD